MANRRARGGGSSNRKIVVTLLLVGVIAGVVFGSSIGSGSNDDGAERAGPAPELVPIDAYRVTYLTDSRGGGDSVITTEELAMRRPFESHIFEYRGSGSDKELLVERTTALGLNRSSGGRQPLVVVTPPGTPPFDIRLDAVLDDLVRRGAVIPGKQKTVNGRRCTIIKTKDPIVGAKPEPPAANGDHADNCIDRHGIVIEERWWLANKLTRTRTVLKLDLSPTFAADEFAITEKPIDLADGGNLLTPVEALPEGALTVDAPAGFELRGTFQYYVGRGTDGGGPSVPLLRSVQTWVSGPDFITIEQGQDAPGSGLPTPSGTVSVPTLTDAGILSSVSGSEVFGKLGPGAILRLRSSLPPERLLAVARTLRK